MRKFIEVFLERQLLYHWKLTIAARKGNAIVFTGLPVPKKFRTFRPTPSLAYRQIIPVPLKKRRFKQVEDQDNSWDDHVGRMDDVFQ